MHISDQVREDLISQGWDDRDQTDGNVFFYKRIENFAAPGSVSTGARVVLLVMDRTGRWLERHDGWGNVEREVDLRQTDVAANAIRGVLA